MPKPLDIEVRDLLIAKKGDWQSVADSSGVSYSWLSKFVNGHIGNPGYAKLVALQKQLSKPTKAAA